MKEISKYDKEIYEYLKDDWCMYGTYEDNKNSEKWIYLRTTRTYERANSHFVSKELRDTIFTELGIVRFVKRLSKKLKR